MILFLIGQIKIILKSYATSPIASKRYTDVNLNKSIAIIFGSENKGLTKKVINLSNNTISIPMLGQMIH